MLGIWSWQKGKLTRRKKIEGTEEIGKSTSSGTQSTIRPNHPPGQGSKSISKDMMGWLCLTRSKWRWRQRVTNSPWSTQHPKREVVGTAAGNETEGVHVEQEASSWPPRPDSNTSIVMSTDLELWNSSAGSGEQFNSYTMAMLPCSQEHSKDSTEYNELAVTIWNKNSNSSLNSKFLFYKDCSLGSVKNLSNN